VARPRAADCGHRRGALARCRRVPVRPRRRWLRGGLRGPAGRERLVAEVTPRAVSHPSVMLESRCWQRACRGLCAASLTVIPAPPAIGGGHSWPSGGRVPSPRGLPGGAGPPLVPHCLAHRGGGRRVGGSIEDRQRLVIVDHDVPPEVRPAAETARGGLIAGGAGFRVTCLKVLLVGWRSALWRGVAVLARVVCHAVLLRREARPNGMRDLDRAAS
jgi:hypothetical protein